MIKSSKYFILFLVFLFSNVFSNTLLSENMKKEILISSYIKGINLAKGFGEIILQKDNLKVKLKANTVGIFSLISQWEQVIIAEGKLYKEGLKSNIYKSNDSRGNKKGHIYIDYSTNAPEIISAQPDPRTDERREKISKNQLLDTLDPFMGILDIGITGNCKSSVAIFDGKRKYIIRSEKIENTKIKSDFFFEKDFEALMCKFYIDKVAGYTNKEKNKYPQEGFIWIKKLNEYKMYIPVKIKIKTKWGSFSCLIKERNNTSESNSM